MASSTTSHSLTKRVPLNAAFRGQHVQLVIGLVLKFCAIWAVLCAPAYGETATYLSPTDLTADEVTALSVAGDNAGVTIARSESLQLLFDEPFPTSVTDDVSFFTLPPNGGGVAIGEIRLGQYVDGEIRIVRRGLFFTGQTISLSNFTKNQCASIGGCNFVEFITRATSSTAEGVRVDYVQINGEVVSVAAPAPEPGVWALMITGFVGVALRSKQVRRQNRRRYVRQDAREKRSKTSLADALFARLRNYSAAFLSMRLS